MISSKKMPLSNWKWRAGILSAVAITGSVFASEPMKINGDGSTVPSSVASELKYFLGKPNALLNIRDIEAQGGYRKGKIATDAWSDSYWPDIQGGIGAAYTDSDTMGMFFPFGNILVETHRDTFFENHASLWGNTASLTEEQIAQMSPSEKYDLLVGDENFTLTRRVWEQVVYRHKNKPMINEAGRFVFDKDGNMLYEPKKTAVTAWWAGICNGWAPASINLERPQRTVVLTNARGQKIKFYPSDIKGLASQLWAYSPINTSAVKLDHEPEAYPLVRHSGFRCNQTSIKRTFIGSRPLDPACQDVNPGVWHLAVINRVGVDGLGFIMDSKMDSSVWNHPITNYQYSYFSPWTRRYGTLADSMVPIKKVSEYKKYRSPRAQYVVGVEMRVTSLANTWVSSTPKDTDSAKDDKKAEDIFFYDLELDENGNIIGGEWLLNRDNSTMSHDDNQYKTPDQLNHPDFIWAPLPGWKAYATWDRPDYDDPETGIRRQYGTWDGNGAVPEGIRTGAIRSSQQMQPLAEVVDLLINHSRR